MEKKNYVIAILNIALVCSIITTIISGCYKGQKESEKQIRSKLNEGPTEWTSVGCDIFIKNVVIEQHKYVIIKSIYNANIIHSESCPCKDIY